MRLLETLLCCLMLPALAVVLFAGGFARDDAYIILALLAAVLAAHVLWEGIRWQLAPLYLAALFLLALIALSEWLPHTLSFWLAAACLVLVAVSIVLSILLPMFKLPAPSGAYPVGTRLLYTVDPGRDSHGGTSLRGKRELREVRELRELMVQLWYPAEPLENRRAGYRRLRETTPKSSHHAVLSTHSFWNAPIRVRNSPYPVLLFSPAWTGQRTQSTFLMQELASHGFVVASIDHTCYSGRVAFPDGRVLDGRSAPELGMFTGTSVADQVELISKHVLIEAQDQIFVLDQLAELNSDAASPWFAQLDLTRVGSFGHSIGGAAASQACYLDPRIKAALNLDGWIAADVLKSGLAKPWMVMYGRGSESQPSPEELRAASPAIQRYWEMNQQNYAAVQQSLKRFGGYRLYINGASHWNFTDRALYSPRRSWTGAGQIAPRRALQIISQYSRAFFSQVLKETNEPLLRQSTSAFPELDFEVWGKSSKATQAVKIFDITGMQARQ